MARHNTNHKGKAEGCEACRIEAEFDKQSKIIRKMNNDNKKRVSDGWKTEKRTSSTRGAAKRSAS